MDSGAPLADGAADLGVVVHSLDAPGGGDDASVVVGLADEVLADRRSASSAEAAEHPMGRARRRRGAAPNP